MKEHSLKLAQRDIDEALTAVENIQKSLGCEDSSKEEMKESFMVLSKKVNELENLLKEEGIL